MKRSGICIAGLAALSISAVAASAQTKSAVDKLYILNCGEGAAGDISRWSPGVNVELFPTSMLLVQKAEYDWPSPLGVGRFKPEHPVTKLEGDYDVFGDGSVTIIATPGHTPGHQSLLVKLPKTGTLVLSGDAVHFKDNWDNRRVPSINTDKDKTAASMQRIADVLAKEKAQLWINHDKAQTDTLKHAPEFYE